MKYIHFIPLWLLALWCSALSPIRASAQHTIIGPDTVCIGVPANYTVDIPGMYSWAVTPVTDGSVLSGNGTDAVTVVFTEPGSKTLLAISLTTFTPATKSVYVIPGPELSVTGSADVGCRNMAIDSIPVPPMDLPGYGTSMEDDGDCLKACANSIVHYYARHSEGELTWNVSGPALLNDWGDSIAVQWGDPGSAGTITAVLESPCGPVYQTICVEVIERPTAQFAIAPSQSPAGNFSVCVETPVSFRDLSTANSSSPVVSWYWDFGDGHSSGQRNPTHSYNTGGTYDVSLIVTNACNCSDTYTVTVTVFSDPGPEIACPSVVCAGKTATYTTTASCGTYNWTVTGGSVTDGGGTGDDYVTVKWDYIPDGIGYVSLQTPSCGGLCPATTVVKVTVVHSDAEITGPTDICTGVNYEYSLPLWPGTQWNWGVINQPSAVQGIRNDHKVHLNFSNPGTYQVHGTYLNGITQCGGDTLLTVTVKEPATIVGPGTACAGASALYTLSNSASVNWTLETPSGTQTGTGASFNASFPVAGDYILYIGGSYCAPAFPITVTEGAAAVALIEGVDVVCLNTPYTYEVTTDEPGTVLVWEATGGTVSPPSGSGKVTVTWTASSGLQLKAWRQQTKAPYCTGAEYVLNVTADPLNPSVSGPSTVCANSYSEYSANYTTGDSYFWTIVPSEAGSVDPGEVYNPDITVMWNHTGFSTNATLHLEVRRCGQVINRSYNVTINPSPLPVFTTLPSTACPGKVTLAVTPGAQSYTWYIPGVFTGQGGHEMEITFPPNTGGGPVYYDVYVTASGATPGVLCPPVGQVAGNILINPGPLAYASVDGPLNLCGATVTLVGTYVDPGGSPTFQWTHNGSPVGPPSSSITTNTDGDYQFFVSSVNGCTAASNVLTLTDVDCGGGQGEGCTMPTVYPELEYEENCGVITLDASLNATPGWRYSVPPDEGANTLTPVYYSAGVYNISYREIWPSPYCYRDTTIQVIVPFMPHFYPDIRCDGFGNYDVTFIDRSSTLDGYTVTGVSWLIKEVGTTPPANPDNGSVNGFTSRLAAGGTYTITQTITVWDDNALRYRYCSKDSTITLPEPPSVSILASSLTVCSDVPIDLQAILTPPGAMVATYFWDFDGEGESKIPAPQSSFTVSIPTNYDITLNIQDIYGCEASNSQIINVRPNELDGGISGGAIVCTGTPVTLTYNNTGSGTPNQPYVWHWGKQKQGTPVPSLSPSESGSYWIEMYDAYQCRLITDPENVVIIPMPPAVISGGPFACAGEPFRLDGFAGPGIDYAWRLNGGSVFSTDPAVDIPGLSPGAYTYSLELGYTDPITSITCTNTDLQIIQVRSQPSAPDITGPYLVDCNRYEIELEGSHTQPGSFNWSNGVSGPDNTVYEGGAYRLWFTDVYGCRSHEDIYVPPAPTSLAEYIPEGCYSLCDFQLSMLTLYGPPGVDFRDWKWMRNNVADLSGSYSLVSPYPVPGPGQYQLYMDNWLCTYTTPGLTITERECNDFGCLPDIDPALTYCDPDIPGRYHLTTYFNTRGMGGTVTMSSDIGPVFPSVTNFTSSHSGVLNLQLNSLSIPLMMSTTTITMLIEYDDGKTCFYSWVVTGLSNCYLYPQRQEMKKGEMQQMLLSHHSISVYPNPSTYTASVEFDYGNVEGKRVLEVYDIAGRKVADYRPAEAQGAWTIYTKEWQSGIYLIRMLSGTETLHTFKLVVSH